MSAAASSSSSAAASLSTEEDAAAQASIERKLKRMRESVDELQKQGAEILSEIQKVDQRHKLKLQERYDELQQRQKQVEAEQQAWEETTAKARKVSSSAPRKLKLNVGGQTHMTTIDTLTAEKGTFFAAMFSEHFDTKPDADGEIFIDRDPRHFALIVNHLRGIDIMPFVEQLSVAERKLLEQDVDYYQIESLAQLLGMRKPAVPGRGWDLDESKKSVHVTFTRNEDGSIQVDRGGDTFSAFIPVIGNKGVSAGAHEWSVRLDYLSNYNNRRCVIVGVCKLMELMPYFNGEKRNGSFEYVWGQSNNGQQHHHSHSLYYQSCNWSIADIIQVKLDCDQGKLCVDDHITIDVPAGEELYPVFLLQDSTGLTLLPQGLDFLSRGKYSVNSITQINRFGQRSYNCAKINQLQQEFKHPHLLRLFEYISYSANQLLEWARGS